MADQLHASELRKGAESWNQWRIDNADLEPDLSHIDFGDARNAGAAWDGANERTNLSGYNLNSVTLDHADLSKAKLWLCELRDARLRWTVLRNADLFGAKMIGADCHGGIFDNAELSNADLRGARLGHASFKNATCIGTVVAGSDVTGADFAGADLRGVDFAPWTVTLLGEPKIPNEYPETALDDVHGLSQATRRMVEAAQYLRARWRDAKGAKLTLRMWGMSCGYGQSLGRWLVLSAVLIVLFALALTTTELHFAVYEVQPVVESGILRNTAVSGIGEPGIGDALYISVVTFTTLGFGDIAPVSRGGKLLIMAEVIIGYAMLGALVSILANKLLVLT